MSIIDRNLISSKPSCYIFDIDGCLADSNSIILTYEEVYNKKLEEYKEKEEAYKKELAIYEEAINLPENKLVRNYINKPVKPIKPTKPSKDLKRWCSEYFYENIDNVSAITGVLDLFVSLALNKRVIILTARSEEYKQSTLNWLKKVITERYNSNMYRRIDFISIFKPEKYMYPDHAYKKEKVLELAKQYNIELIVDDSPYNIKEFSELGFLALQPNIDYKDLK